MRSGNGDGRSRVRRRPGGVARAAVAVLLCLQVPTGLTQPENPVAASQERLREAAAALREDDIETAIEAYEAARELNPYSLYSRFELARAHALSGDSYAALGLLEELALDQAGVGIVDDPAFDALREHPRFVALVDRLRSSTAALVRSEPVLKLDLLGIVPEGIAADPVTGRLFFGSMRSGDVFVVDALRNVSRFGVTDPAGRQAALGMTVDADRGLLWVAASGFETAEGFDAEAHPGSTLYGIDLESGALEQEHHVDDPAAAFNDVTVGPDGLVYVSGSPVRRLDENTGRLVPVPGTEALFGANGLALDRTGATLFVAVYPATIAAVDLGSGRSRYLELPPGLTLYGIDGLYQYDGGLIAIQNGTRPWRLLRLTLDTDHERVTDFAVLERGVAGTTPTTGAIIGNRIYYVGEAPPPAAVPAHFPPALRQNPGAVVIRRALLDP